jgi:hypothetical protein
MAMPAPIAMIMAVKPNGTKNRLGTFKNTGMFMLPPFFPTIPV